MRLSFLLQDIISLPLQVDPEIQTLALDSRAVTKNTLFFAVNGSQQSGHAYIADAIARGASAVVVEAPYANEGGTWQQNIPLIPIEQLREKLGLIAARFYGEPAKQLRIIGVTGTSGKTSCTHFIAQILSSLDAPCGLIGSLGNGFYGALSETSLTTPDALSMQAILKHLLGRGAKAVAMEVSSHSLDQGRVNAIPFEIGMFTNLSQDHLDYHQDMETYAAVKRRFISELPVKNIILNVDDARGRQWARELTKERPLYGYSLTEPKSAHTLFPLIYAKKITLSLKGLQVVVLSPWGEGELNLPLIGRFNLSNALAALTALCVYGLPFKQVLAALSGLQAVPGRMQLLGGEQGPLVVVDYAHKPDALEKVLQALRPHTSGKLICVFGCGGERDQGKRPMMAAIAEALADKVIVTNDNPRHENPEEIAAQIKAGFKHPAAVNFVLDRAKAITNSIEWAFAKDCVLIAGKGAERYQDLGDARIPFDDVEKAKLALSLFKKGVFSGEA
jgi:UDP-N-acetylmuramoyl-L-alanyl-D-glutamate--2,6-diaminopimelate ligase